MNRNPSLPLVAFLGLSIAILCGPRLANAQMPSGEEASPATLTVMTHNLKFASPNPLNAWPARRPLMREVIQQPGHSELKERTVEADSGARGCGQRLPTFGDRQFRDFCAKLAPIDGQALPVAVNLS